MASLNDIAARTRLLTRLSIAAGVLGLVALLWALARFDHDPEQLALMGNFVSGVVGSLWSLAGLFLIFVAFLGQQAQLIQQQHQLDLAREDMAAQRAEFEAQRRQLEQQTLTFDNQRFDSTFFELVRYSGDAARAVREKEGMAEHSGAMAFEQIYGVLVARFNHAVQQGTSSESLEDAVASYERTYEERQALLGPYFRSLYHVMKFVDDRDDEHATFEIRKRYSNLLRARLSSPELALLFYNVHSRYGQGFRPLVERYSLLKHLPPAQLLRGHHLTAYSEGAFDTVATAE
jgi:hypothetical protein